MIRFHYDSPAAAALEPGLYLVSIDGELVVAEWDAGQWNQIGIDYDVWQYNGNYAASAIYVMARLDLGSPLPDLSETKIVLL